MLNSSEIQYCLDKKLCPRDNPHFRLGFCPKVSKRCFREERAIRSSRGCGILAFPLIESAELQKTDLKGVAASSGGSGIAIAEKPCQEAQKIKVAQGAFK